MSPYNEGDYRARVHVIQKALESAYRNGKYDPDVARALDEEKYWAYTNRKTHQLITINWDPNFCDFSIMNRIVSKKWMHEWYYVWEFVNEKGEFSHPHVHLLIKKVKPVSQVIREIAYTAGVANNYVDVKEIVTRDLRNVRKYMQKTVHTMLRSVKSTCYITFTAIYDKKSFLRMKVKWNRNLHGQEKQNFFEKNNILSC